ncbi:MarR family winged helix-turn-helix transcriptional regulator [Methanobrevibacter sp. DSM 116169]|uniref:MarR family winged helix-turn-helix transcriptional regulator n=1 Tax=Methanobrevibacter sp. DSM 116169 TaxID=3242727 RepID=UPI0038FC4B8F
MNDSYGYVLGSILQKFGEQFDKALENYSITTNDYRVLMAVNNKPNINQKEVGQMLKIDRTTIVHIIDNLEDNNYLIRIKNPNDRRSFQLSLTKKGENILEPICEVRDEIHDDCLKNLSKNQKKVLREICKKIGDD